MCVCVCVCVYCMYCMYILLIYDSLTNHLLLITAANRRMPVHDLTPYRDSLEHINGPVVRDKANQLPSDVRKASKTRGKKNNASMDLRDRNPPIS